MKKTAIIFSLFAVVALALTAGCGGQKLPDGMPKLNPTTITLTVDGKPFAGAIISLFPATGTFQWSVSAVTDASGKAVMKTQGNYDGAPEGELKVCVQAVRNIEGETSATEMPTDDYNKMVEWQKAVEDERQTFLVAGAQYGTAETTPLSITIKKGKNSATFDIPEDGTQIK